MAIAINNSTTYETSVATTSFSFSHTVNSGLSSPILFVGMAGMGTSGTTEGAQFTFTNVTYNSVSLTQITQVNTQSVSRGYQSGFWKLNNPSVGTYNISITASGNVTGLCVYVCTLTGADQNTTGTPTFNSTAANPLETTITTTRDNSMLFVLLHERGDNNFAYTGITNTNILADLHSNSSSPASIENQMAIGNRVATTQTGYTLGINNSSNPGLSIIGVEILEALPSFNPMIIFF